MNTLYPPVSFYFSVNITGIGTDPDSSFQEVSGLTAERDVIDIKEGGENRFSHRLPDRAKYGNLTLKRGVVLSNSGLATWCKGIMESDFDTPITTNDIVVSLLNANGNPLMTWNCIGAWPVKWSVSDLTAERNELSIESLELAYSYFIKAPASGASQAS